MINKKGLIIAAICLSQFGFISASYAENVRLHSSSYKQDGKIYDLNGNIYSHEGTYQYFDGVEMVEKDCSEALLFTDPSVVPSFEKYPSGSLPGSECTLKKIG